MNILKNTGLRSLLRALALFCCALLSNLQAQSLINVDFGVGSASKKTGFAATGQSTNDFWNLLRFYDPRYAPDTPLVFGGEMANLKLSDGAATAVCLALTNAPGVWGNATGDPMYDSYVFSQNGSNIVVTLTKLDPGRYNFYFYGHADPDASGEQNSVFRIRSANTNYGPLTASSSAGWKASNPWQEGSQYVVFRDIEVRRDIPVIIDVAPGPNGVAVLNGLQIISKGTSPPKVVESVPVETSTSPTNLLIREIRYEGQVSESEARLTAELEMESMTTNEISAPLFQGDVAVITTSLPEGVRIARVGGEYRIFVSGPGTYNPKVEVVARITRAEPWNQISFVGPPAAIASLKARGEGEDVELQQLSGTTLDADKSKSRVEGFLSADRVLSLRWQSRAAEVTRKALVTAETTAAAHISSAVIKFTTELRYEILQANVPRLTIAIPTNQALTKLQGEQIRDWKIETAGERQVLTIEFIRPIEKNYNLVLFSEQVAATPNVSMTLPQPLAIEREAGSFAIFADDALVEVASISGLSQVSAPAGAMAAYRYYGRPLLVTANVNRIEPVLKVSDRVSARLEETRLLLTHALSLVVEKAGIYALELTPQTGFVIADVKGDGVEEWKVVDGKIRVSFAARLLGARQLDVQMEQALKALPPKILIAPLRAAGAAKEITQIGATAAPGLRVKTDELTGLSEIPVSQLANKSDELLAFNSQEPDWRLTLSTERLPARVVAEIFNLITVGDGLVGGSATVRYGLINQGAQQFRLKLPGHWKNVEFTGPNIRGKEQQGDVWIINLQDKAWGGYTLVVTYDYQFDPAKATLDAGGLHVLDAEHETGSVAVTTAASLKLQPAPLADPLHQIDQAELATTDRALITRPVLLAYRYTGKDYALKLQVTRHEEERGIDAVADRTQLTSVLTEAGEMLTQASFMVKNNDKQFQRFQLPAGAKFWGCYVNNQPSKAERDGDWLLVSLPRGANRDEAFAVDLVYAQNTDVLGARWMPRKMEFQVPVTDVPNTYAEWELYVPKGQRLTSFGGTMAVARGTTYNLGDALRRAADFYSSIWKEYGAPIVFFGGVIFVLTLMVAGATRRGWNGVVGVLVVLAIMAILASMMLPALSSAKQKAQRISAVNNLKQIGTALRVWSGDNGDAEYPESLDQLKNELGGSDRVLIDPKSGEPFVYIGKGKSDTYPQAVIAYSPVDQNGREVLLGDGSVQHMSSEQFAAAMEGDARMDYGKAKPAAEISKLPSLTAGKLVEKMGEVPSVAPSATLNIQSPQEPMATHSEAAPPVIQSSPTAAGIRSIRIEIPRNGQPFTFTKVLNLSKEPLSVKMSIMTASTFVVARSAFQVTAFLCGLGIFWLGYRQENTFRMTAGLAFALGAVGALFISGRVLHLVLIVAAPMLVAAVMILIGIKLWPRKPVLPKSAPYVPPTSPDSGVPPVAACIALFLFLTAYGAQASSVNAAAIPVITSATYTGTIREPAAQFEAQFKVTALQTNQTVVLFGDDVAVREFTVLTGQAKLVREDGRVSVLLPQGGAAEVRLKFLAKLGGNVGKRQLAFQMPPALASHLTAIIDEPEADVDFPTAIAFKRINAAQQTRVEAIIGSNDRVDMQWTPRVKRAAEIAATVFAENRALVTFGGGVVVVRDTVDYQITQGELRQARLQLPAQYRLLRVEGDSIRTWELREENGQSILVVDLLKGVSPAWRLTVEAEKVLEALPVSSVVEVPRALDVKRENGFLAIRAGEEVSLSVESVRELQRVDSAEFIGERKEKAVDIFTAYRFLKPAFELVVKAEPVHPQIEAIVRDQVRISSEQVSLSANIDYTIKRAGIFGLKLALPSGYRVQGVTGENIQQWTTRADKDAQYLDVTFGNRTTGAYPLQVKLLRLLKELPPTAGISGVHPLGVQKLAGFVSVIAEPGVAIRTAALQGMVEVPFASLGETNVSAATTVLAYKFLSSQPGPLPEWKLEVTTDTVESWVRAEIANTVSVSEGMVSGRAVIRYDIQNAPVKDFCLKIPTNCNNVEITGSNIRRRDQSGEEWRVELQNKVNGTFFLAVSFEKSIDFKSNAMEVAGIQALGVERETGVVVVKARPPLQVLEKSLSGELTKIDVGETPEWASSSTDATGDGAPTVLAYRYARPGYSLLLDAKRFEEAAVLQALIDQARLTTVIAADGQVMTEMSLLVRNNGLQHLEIELPAGAKVWSAFVAGQPVRPAKREGKLLLPLENNLTDEEAPVSVELTYVGLEKFPADKAEVELISPKLDVPLKNARWDLYLPPDYAYDHFAGSMAHTTESAPLVQSYSLSEYRVQEAEKKASRKAEVKSVLSSAHKRLASGDTKALNRAYKQLRVERSEDDATKRELKDLQQNLDRIQSSNLIHAQQAYNDNNQGLGFGGGVANNAFTYDASVAQQQWSKLQQAQELAVARVQPLRINLPTRGLHYAFTQVLQTQVKKPLTIRFLAANTLKTSWFQTAVGCIAGFAALWALVVIGGSVSRRRSA